MIDFIIYTFFSSFEYVALIYFAFVLFRLTLRHYTYHLFFIAISLSYVSYTFRMAAIDFATPVVQMIAIFLFVWLMFRIQVFYAFVVTITGYLGYALVQGVFILSLLTSGAITYDQVQPNTVLGVSIQIGTAALMMAISQWLERLRWGFDFVPHSEFAKVQLKNENRILMIIMLLSFFSFGLTYFIIMYNEVYEGLNILVGINLIAIILVIYFARKKDKMEE